MKSNSWLVFETLPVIIYVVGGIASLVYFLYAFVATYLQLGQISGGLVDLF